MHWRLTADPVFLTSLDQLEDTDETAALTEKLILRIKASPLRAEPIGHTTVRGVRGGTPRTRFPTLVLFYTAEEGVIRLLRLERDVLPQS
jgi:hypothetical protein